MFTRLLQGSFGSKKQKATQVCLKKNFRSTNNCHYNLWTMLLCAWHCTSMIAFNTDNNPLSQMVIIIHFLDGGTDSSKSDTITGRAKIPTQRVWLLDLNFHPLSSSVRMCWHSHGCVQIESKGQSDFLEIGTVETWDTVFIFLLSVSSFHGTDLGPYELISPIYLFTPANSVAGLSFGPISHGQKIIW